MTIAVWIADILLGVLFVITGSFKFFQTKEKVVASGGAWAADFAPGIIKAIACTELLCGLLVALSKIFGLSSYLTFVGASLISLIMIGSIFVHLKRKEFQHAAINTVFLLIALFVAYSSKPF